MRNIHNEIIPPACCPAYNKVLAEFDPDVILFRSRKDVVYHVWYVMDRHDFNIFKEGPKYAVRLGNKIYATPWRALYQFTVKELEDCIRNEYFY